MNFHIMILIVMTALSSTMVFLAVHESYHAYFATSVTKVCIEINSNKAFAVYGNHNDISSDETKASIAGILAAAVWASMSFYTIKKCIKVRR